MPVFRIDPLRDGRWSAFVERNRSGSVFHTVGWLEALRRTYGYEPVVFTTSRPGWELTNGIVFCHVNSWLTGRRLVSLPFSDHCQPLVEDLGEMRDLLQIVKGDLERERWRYIEIRLLEDQSIHWGGNTDFPAVNSYCFHRLDLRPDLDKLFWRFHKDCVQRKIKRAKREGLNYEEGRSEAVLQKFYGLMLQTRRRQQLPPQPLAWFRNLIDCLGDKLKIWVASKDEWPVAAIFTLRHKNVLVYKYGCSDARFNNCGGMQFLFWKAIQEAKNSAIEQFDLGRSDWHNSGLITFKDRWGTTPSTLIYRRHPATAPPAATTAWNALIAKQIFTYVPNSILVPLGQLLYKHIG